MKKIESTVVVTDVRNFTGLSDEFEERGSTKFIEFMKKYYELHLLFAEEIAGDQVYISTTGDGILCVFKGDSHHANGYSFALAMYRVLFSICKKFSKKNKVDLQFGIGADSGSVRKICSHNRGFEIKTYLGPVINRTTRIENLTKDYHYTNMAVGGNLYKTLIKSVYKDISDEVLNHKNYDKVLELQPDLILKSKELLLYYIFEKVLKGVKEPTPIFRLANAQANSNQYFFRAMIRLIGKERTKKLKEIGKQY